MHTSKCNEYVERDRQVVAPTGHLSYFPLVVEKGEGALLTDVDGNTFIDFLASAASLNLGSSHPAVTKAMMEQLSKSAQYTAAYSYNVPMISFAEALVKLYPGGVRAKVAFGNCGSDANDAAVKYARAYTGRSHIITFLNGYHGSTYGSISLSTVTTRIREKMGPFLPDVHSFPFSNCYRCPYGKEEHNCKVECLQSLLTAFETYLPPKEVACFILEPIQGDSGIVPASPKFMAKLQALCEEYGILLIAEEVQQAFGRAGGWFSIERYNMVPDGIILGKTAGGGQPLGAFMARAEIMDSLPAPAHLFTLGGNALSCAAGLAALQVMQEPGFFDEVNRKGEKIKKIFENLAKMHKCIGQIRCFGMSLGVEIVKDRVTKEKDTVSTAKICYHAYENGLILISLAGNVLRVQPPLIITDEQIATAGEILAKVFANLEAGRIPDSVLEHSKGW